MKNNLFALAGGVLGGVAGFFAFLWIRRQGLVALALPGALVGVGAGLVAARSLLVPILCGVGATALGFYADFTVAPFDRDQSLGYYVTHVHKLDTIVQIMIALGGAIGFWIPFRRRADALLRDSV